MANELNTLQALSDNILIQMEANTVFMMNSNRDYEEAMTKWVTDTAAEVQIRLPNNFLVNNTWDISSVDRTVQERFATLTADQVANVSFDLDTFEDTFEIDVEKSARTTDQIPSNLGLNIDAFLSQKLFDESYFTIGTAGSIVNSFTPISQAAAFMNDMDIPDGGQRFGVVSEDTYANVAAFKELQNSFNVKMNKDITRQWMIGPLAGFKLFHNHAVIKHVAGVGLDTDTPSGGKVGAGTVKTAVASGTSMVVENLGASTTGVFLKGDKIDIVERSTLHPRTLNSTGKVFQVTVTDVSVDASPGGEATVNFLPAIVSTDTPYKNIDAEIPIGAALNLHTANELIASTTKLPYTANVFYHKSALMFAAPKIKQLFSDDTFSSDGGINIRISTHGNILTSVRTSRLDTVYGGLVRGERSVVVAG